MITRLRIQHGIITVLEKLSSCTHRQVRSLSLLSIQAHRARLTYKIRRYRKGESRFGRGLQYLHRKRRCYAFGYTPASRTHLTHGVRLCRWVILLFLSAQQPRINTYQFSIDICMNYSVNDHRSMKTTPYMELFSGVQKLKIKKYKSLSKKDRLCFNNILNTFVLCLSPSVVRTLMHTTMLKLKCAEYQEEMHNI